MKIGIYKPYKKVFFHNQREDLSAVSYEVVNVAKIFAERGHQVFMLSDTDLSETPSINNILIDTKLSQDYDRIILFSGSFHKDKHPDIIRKLAERTQKLDFLLTDLRLLPPNQDDYNLFSTVFTQATRDLPMIPLHIPQVYGGVAEFLPYQFQFGPLEESLMRKDIEFYFGGTFRDRERAMQEFILHDNHVVTTKCDIRGIDTRVDRDEYFRLLDRAKFSITIADESYNRNHFITPRFYENILHDIVGFVETDFDRDARLIPKEHYLRVNSYVEMRQKMDEINQNPSLYHQLLLEQRSRITPEIVSGDVVYSKLNQIITGVVSNDA